MLGLDGSALGACVIADVSAGGARLLIKPATNVPNRFLLVLSWDGQLQRECQLRAPADCDQLFRLIATSRSD